MKIDESLDSYVYSNVGAEVGRGNNGGVDCDIGAEVGSGDSKGIELKLEYEVGSRDGRSADKGIKGIKSGVSMGVGVSVFWGVDIGVGDRIGSDDVITFGIDDGSEMGYYDGFFCG